MSHRLDLVAGRVGRGAWGTHASEIGALSTFEVYPDYRPLTNLSTRSDFDDLLGSVHDTEHQQLGQPTPVGFALWTVLLLFTTVGVYRWSRILTGRVPISELRADWVEGDDWYRRAMRAHANCVENLPVFGAIVFALYASGVAGTTVNVVCIGLLAARVVQSIIHASLVQTDAVVSMRFAFYFLQIVGFLWLTAIVVGRAA